MGQALRTTHRAVLNYNAKNRAHRLLDKQAAAEGPGTAAPRHPTTLEALAAIESDPEIRRAVEEKHPKLDKNLKDVRVESVEPPPPKESRDKSKLPSSGYVPDGWARDMEWGIIEPPKEKISHGRITFTEAKSMMSDRLAEFGESDTLAIPTRWKDSETVRRVPKEQLLNMLKYFSPFEKQGTMAIATRDYMRSQLTDGAIDRSDLEGLMGVRDQHRRLKTRMIAERQEDESVQIDHRKQLIDEEFEKLRLAKGRPKDDPRLLHPDNPDMPPPLPPDDPRLRSSQLRRTTKEERQRLADAAKGPPKNPQ